jgi:hypothetical protein
VEQVEAAIDRQQHGKHVSTAADTDSNRGCSVFYVAIARQWHGKHISTATNEHATIEELLETVFSVWSMPRLQNEDCQQLH